MFVLGTDYSVCSKNCTEENLHMDSKTKNKQTKKTPKKPFQLWQRKGCISEILSWVYFNDITGSMENSICQKTEPYTITGFISYPAEHVYILCIKEV